MRNRKVMGIFDRASDAEKLKDELIEAGIARLKFLSGKKFDPGCVDAFERAFLMGDVTPAKARKASVAQRQFDIHALMGDAPPTLAPAVVPAAPVPSV